MQLIELIGYILLGYIILMFVLTIILIPNLYWKAKSKNDLPKKVKLEMKKIGKKFKTKKEVLEEVAELHVNRFYGFIAGTFWHLPLLWVTDHKDLWEKKGYLHCHQHNVLIEKLLIETERFNKKDFKYKLASVYGEIHQYLKVNISEDPKKQKWIYLDPFAISLGFEVGEKLPFLSIREIKKRKLQPKGLLAKIKKENRKI